MIVLDASAAISALLNEGVARELLASEQVHVPHLIDSEIVNGLRRVARGAPAGLDRASVALAGWLRLGVVRHPALDVLGRIWELRDNLTAYDVTYVALAEQLGCPLVTADGPLSRAADVRCPVTVVPR